MYRTTRRRHPFTWPQITRFHINRVSERAFQYINTFLILGMAMRWRNEGAARGNPQQNAQAHQGSRPGRRRGVEVDGHSGLVARRHHLHWRILQECREAYLLQGRVSEGSGPSLQLESRRKRTPRDRHPRRRRSRRVRLQGARSPSGRPQQFWQVETFEESEVLRDSSPERVRHWGGGGVVPPERAQVEDGLDRNS